MAATFRMMPPANGKSPTMIVNGRKYTCALGSTIDVVDFDAVVLAHNGWTLSTTAGSGATSARPASAARGATYHDTTLGVTVSYDGASWRDPATGNAV